MTILVIGSLYHLQHVCLYQFAACTILVICNWFDLFIRSKLQQVSLATGFIGSMYHFAYL
ncbi:hypothetical protein HanPI659440_Chr09g0329181 [Helianthus annuus]|nr:hypothetical protein HanHA300_Chr09g0312261 [Helianthus annuus]KAJ0541848.1 hypothetical protein HanHA89_Chr09g0333201 [Helianthus annuus]KAJ0706923.1 hypothetical protein HanLR1_Chr09g0312651 [Helianthus annuus]KAJ0710941.1 hypothetical protein HanOQP8_Chr09g0318211 [Helianthus annuus]KAJ0752859.1 hypothetical protein HanPI659440_Chr09g0329181 [Helianthus annuus]